MNLLSQDIEYKIGRVLNHQGCRVKDQFNLIMDSLRGNGPFVLPQDQVIPLVRENRYQAEVDGEVMIVNESDMILYSPEAYEKFVADKKEEEEMK